MAWRDLKRAARLQIHETFQVEAMYLPTPDDMSPPDPYAVTVRVHTAFEDIGKVKGTAFDFSFKHDTVPTIILLKSEVSAPKRKDIISVAAGEAYRVDNVRPTDDLTITVEVVRMKESDTTGLPVPGE